MSEITWGAILQSRIAARNLTRSQLAGKMGFTKARASELCSRKTPPRTETVLRLAEQLGCEPSDLDARLSDDSLPMPGSRVHVAAKILESKFKLRIEFARHSDGHYMVCRRRDDAPDATPTAIVAGPNREGGWGCLAEIKLQLKVLDALNGHA